MPHCCESAFGHPGRNVESVRYGPRRDGFVAPSHFGDEGSELVQRDESSSRDVGDLVLLALHDSRRRSRWQEAALEVGDLVSDRVRAVAAAEARVERDHLGPVCPHFDAGVIALESLPLEDRPRPLSERPPGVPTFTHRSTVRTRGDSQRMLTTSIVGSLSRAISVMTSR